MCMRLYLGRGQNLQDQMLGIQKFSASKKTLTPSIFHEKKVFAPSLVPSEKCLPLHFWSEKVIAPSFAFSPGFL